MSQRSQSPSIAEWFKNRFRMSSRPDQLNVIPGVIGAISLPQWEFGYFLKELTTNGEDNLTEVIRVPNGQEWILLSLSIRQWNGDGHIDYILMNTSEEPFAGDYNWNGVEYSNIHYLETAALTSFPYQRTFQLPMLQNSWLIANLDWVSVNDNYTVCGMVLRRKW